MQPSASLYTQVMTGWRGISIHAAYRFRPGAMTNYTTFTIKDIGPVTVVRPKDVEILGQHLIHDLTDELLEFVEDQRPGRLLVSLEQVTRYSSEALGGLIRISKRVRTHGGDIKLCMGENLREVFRVTRLDGTLFDIHDSVSEAVAAFYNA